MKTLVKREDYEKPLKEVTVPSEVGCNGLRGEM